MPKSTALLSLVSYPRSFILVGQRISLQLFRQMMISVLF